MLNMFLFLLGLVLGNVEIVYVYILMFTYKNVRTLLLFICLYYNHQNILLVFFSFRGFIIYI